ncbi:MAG TPA: hypothetical protein PKX23_19315 [Verrucomicrobiota bacterium]|nr:hypothetical protein [Verrucomicrobiota bacterium]
MRIAILGWGSLIWDRRDLPITGDWQGDGPVLPIEFSRISDNGLPAPPDFASRQAGRLTLVIDERHGADVPTRYALSPCLPRRGTRRRQARSSLGEAVTDLQRREGCAADNIGFLEVATHRVSPRAAERHPAACERIKTWAAGKGFDAVVWTALGRRFKNRINVPFSPAAAVRFLQGLPDPQKESALEYLRNAPPEVMTPVRTAAIQAGLIAGP